MQREKQAMQSMTRRSALGLSAATMVTSGIVPGSGPVAASASTGLHGVSVIDTNPRIQVETMDGTYRGFARAGIYIFKGVSYGATTEWARRFMPAQPPAKWTGVRTAFGYGPVCPHPHRDGWGVDETQFIYDWDDGYESEDCLRLNLWTPSIQSGGKRPVMVWLHGGGYTAGSSQELPAYDGENLARRGDVVLVSVNHRLGPLGFLDLSTIGGAQFATSGNVGMLDLVRALEWVRDNISQFGGDPGNVMIFGQSGGGGKVSTLMAMPSAVGLFHRAAVQSGSFASGVTPVEAQRLAGALMAQLGLRPNDVAGLQAVASARLIEAGSLAIRTIAGDAPRPGTGPIRSLPRVGWQPIYDGKVVLADAWKDAAPEISRNVPLLVGSTREEFINPSLTLTEPELKDRLQRAFAGHAERIHALLRGALPDESPAKLFAVANAMGLRNRAIDQARMKAAQRGAPAFLYWFTFQPSVLEGRPGAFHCSDLAFCFDNTKRCDQATGDTQDARRLAATMSQAWIDFARSGNPGSSRLVWPPFDDESIPTLVFDRRARVERDPLTEVRNLVLQASS
jgi:para-nitrobenzyl esterase